MKLVNIEEGIDIDIEEGCIYELIVEHKDTFSKIVESLFLQTNGEDGGFIISENGKAEKIDRISDIIIDYYSMSPNNRKIINKLYSLMESVSSDYLVEKAKINADIISILDNLSTSLGFGELEYELDFSWIDMFKIFKVSFSERKDNLLEKISSYIKILSDLTEIKVIFLVNIRSYLSYQSLEYLYEMVKYYKMSLFLIESVECFEKSIEKRYIIDKDRCFIDLNY